MSATLVTNIGQLTTHDPQYDEGSGVLKDAALLAVDGKIAWTGSAEHAPVQDADQVVDAKQRAVIPGFVDSHTHLLFCGDRSAEFEARMSGRSYEAGGIASTVTATRGCSVEQIRTRLIRFITEPHRGGTTSYELKSGYGLTVQDESALLRVAREFTRETTFLGAHVVPAEYKHDPEAYVDLVCGSMLEACAPYAKWIDVFCEEGAFSPDQTRRILRAGVSEGLGIRLHGNQLGLGEGVQIALEYNAASVDHCTYVNDTDVEQLAASQTVVTLLPGVEFSTRSPYPNARRFLDAGVRVALASDCNPGSCFTSSIPFCIALAVREMSMTFDEALYAVTKQGAEALRRDDIGHLAVGASADFLVLDAPTALYLAYRPGVPLIAQTWVEGKRM